MERQPQEALLLQSRRRGVDDGVDVQERRRVQGEVLEVEDADQAGLLRELRTFVDEAAVTNAIFRTNHASNYLPIGGRLPHDRDGILATLDEALAGERPLRPEWGRGL